MLKNSKKARLRARFHFEIPQMTFKMLCVSNEFDVFPGGTGSLNLKNGIIMGGRKKSKNGTFKNTEIETKITKIY